MIRSGTGAAMDYKSLTSLLLRLTGVIILVAAVIAAPRNFLDLYLRDAGGGVNTETWLLTTVASTFPILVGLLLIYFPATVGNRIVSGDGETADTQRLEQTAFSILGLYFVSMAAFDAVYWYAKLRLYSVILPVGWNDRGPWLANNDFAGIASTCAQFVVGILLLLGGRGLANLFHRLRTPPAIPDMPASIPDDGPAGQAPHAP
jgi:hypothetical protein